MQEQEENIQFDNMPNFGGMFSTKTNEWDEEKEYNSLYDELSDKCRPDRFIDDSSDNNKFLLSNQLFAELKSKQGCSDGELIELRDRAMALLGIKISTKKLYEWLDRYLNPKVYTAMKPYDAERVAQSGEYYFRMRECKNDIHALEKLRDDAKCFIDRRIDEEKAQKAQYEKQMEEEKIAKMAKEEENSQTMFGILVIIVLVVAIMIFILQKY